MKKWFKKPGKAFYNKKHNSFFINTFFFKPISHNKSILQDIGFLYSVTEQIHDQTDFLCSFRHSVGNCTFVYRIFLGLSTRPYPCCFLHTHEILVCTFFFQNPRLWSGFPRPWGGQVGPCPTKDFCRTRTQLALFAWTENPHKFGLPHGMNCDRSPMKGCIFYAVYQQYKIYLDNSFLNRRLHDLQWQIIPYGDILV